jgi:hypothetical protein
MYEEVSKIIKYFWAISINHFVVYYCLEYGYCEGEGESVVSNLDRNDNYKSVTDVLDLTVRFS